MNDFNAQRGVTSLLNNSTSSPWRGAGLGLVRESELACGHFAHGNLVRCLVEPRPERRGHRCGDARTEAAALQCVHRVALRLLQRRARPSRVGTGERGCEERRGEDRRG